MLKIKTKISRASLALVSIALIALFYGMSIKPDERLPWHHQIIFTLVSPMQKSVQFVKEKTNNVWNNYIALVNTSKKNAHLKSIIDRQKLELNRLEEVRSENSRLRNLLAFKDSYVPHDVIGAKVIANDPRGDFKVLTIDRGERAGLKQNMPVISSSGLVGRVVDVSPLSAKVLLITDPNNAVDVLVQRSRSRALLVGGGADPRLKRGFLLSRLEYLSKESDVKEDDALVTSGLDGIYPSGLPVGRLADISLEENGVFLNAKVVPFVDFTNLEEVLVLSKR